MNKGSLGSEASRLWSYICSATWERKLSLLTLLEIRSSVEGQELNTREGLLELFRGTPFAALLEDGPKFTRFQQECDKLERENIQLLNYFSPNYPEQLRQIYDPPLLLFVRGNLRCFSEEVLRIAIVGARRADSLACKIASDLAQALSACGASVVSGLAAGIDGAAHWGALKSKGPTPTIAVLGSGLHHIYPRMHERLASEIVEKGGLLLSQFDADEKPYPANFLNRNRVIAGLSLGVVVVQAAARSGSLVTARYALEEGRDVLAVPGSILDSRCEGSNRLLREGAQVVTKIEDIFDCFPALRRGESLPKKEDPKSGVLSFLRKNGPTFLHILEQHFSRETLHCQLLELEMSGSIVRAPGNMIAAGLGE